MYSIDIDVGGTFTDGFFSADGEYHMAKTFTTPYDLTECVLACVREGADAFGLPLVDFMRSTSAMRLSTTLGTNTLLERRGPKIGLLVTVGHEHDLYGERRTGSSAILAEEMILGIDEETSATGAVVRAPDPEQVLRQVRRLIHQGARRVGVAFAGSARNPANEEHVRDTILARYPENYLRSIPIQLSSEVSWSFDDHARTNTLIVNCYLHSDLARGLYRCEDEVRAKGFQQPLLVVHSDGGCARVAKTVAVQTLSSGPAVAVHGAQSLAEQLGLKHILTADMGGTSLDLATLDGGVPRRDEMPEVLGMRLAIPMTATESIAAGGGSIASVVGGAVEVGPESAGASPGPACYGRGGRLATVTDANLILGYLGDGVLGGRLELDRGLAEEAIRRNVCAQLDVSLEEGADLIRRRVDEKMAHEIRGKLEREGLDPGETALFAIGGGGPVHGCSMAELAGIRVVYGFPFGPVFSAFGSSTLDVSHRYSLRPTDLAAIEDPVAAAELVTGLVHQAAIDLKGEGLLWRPRTLTLTAIGSEDEDPVQMRLPEDGEVDAEMLQVLVATAGGESLLAMYLEVRVELEPWTPVLADLIGHPATTPGRRQVRWAGHSQNAAMFELEGLRAGASFDGPAIVVATGTSFVVPSGWTCQIDGSGNPVMRLLAGAS